MVNEKNESKTQSTLNFEGIKALVENLQIGYQDYETISGCQISEWKFIPEKKVYEGKMSIRIKCINNEDNKYLSLTVNQFKQLEPFINTGKDFTGYYVESDDKFKNGWVFKAIEEKPDKKKLKSE